MMFALFTISMVVCLVTVVCSYSLEGRDFGANEERGVAASGRARGAELW